LIAGDGNIPIPDRRTFIGRRREIRSYLRDFVESKTRLVLFTGPGGVGKTALAGLFTRYLLEQHPNTRAMGFRAPFDLESLFEPLRKAAFDGKEESTLQDAMNSMDIREKIRRLLISLSKREKRPFLLVLDNLEDIQDIATLQVNHVESLWLIQTVCDLEANIHVLMTARYAFPGLLDGWVSECRVSDAPYGDILRRIDRLEWPASITGDEKRRIYEVLGGNHRAMEWMGQLLLEQKPESEQLLKKLEQVEAPADTPEKALEVVKDAMRENILFSAVRAQLSPEQDRLLKACTLYRVPVTEDGLMAVETDVEHHDLRRQRLLDYALLSAMWNPTLDMAYYDVAPVVKSLIGDTGFDGEELKSLHNKMGRYHRFQGKRFSKTWTDDLEAIHHFRLSENHSDADELVENVSGFYYRISNFSEADLLVEEIVERDEPPAPWWALNRYGMCRLVLGFPEKALHSFERALSVCPGKDEKGTTLNNISQIYDARGDYDTALKYLEQSLKIQQEIGDKSGEGTTLNNMATTAHARGDYDTALKYLEQSLKIRQEIGDKSGMIATLHNMGHMAKQTNDVEEAIKLFSAALSLAIEIKKPVDIFDEARDLGTIYLEKGDNEKAKEFLTLAKDVGIEVDLPGVEDIIEILKKV
jgi:tetratricopeptide (TPR) repeat protein